ncbi:MAG: pilus assembly protein TadG-related protein [Nocardioides sp.]
MMSRVRDERGATAIMVAILSMVLLGAGALAVDMGNVYAKRAAEQTNVDLAATAAAAKMTQRNGCNTEVVNTAREYLLKAGNTVADQAAIDLGGSATDGNGFIRCADWTVYLTAPASRVDFGLAKALSPDNTGVDVAAYGAARVYSPKGVGIMPAYAARGRGCDWGEQTLLDDSGATGAPIPTLFEDTPVDSTPRPDANTPISLPLGSPTTNVVITGNSLRNVNRVAFTRGPTAGEHEEIGTISVTNSRVEAAIPFAVRSTEALWYIRVSRDGGNTWSDASNSVKIQIGNALLQCDAGASSGNFGAILLPRAGVGNPNTALSLNIALGQNYSLSIFPNAAAGWTCSAGSAGAILPTNDFANCVDTDTGLPAEATEAGLLTGQGIGVPARLEKPTSPGCGSSFTVNFGGGVGSHTLNNDRLSCFVDAGATTSYQTAGYTGPPVISADIFNSPRFSWFPVFGRETSSGGSAKYQIVDFRPGFITGETSGDWYNGLYLPSQGGKKTLRAVKVIFFNVNALPASISDGEVTDYLGVGTKIIRLVE